MKKFLIGLLTGIVLTGLALVVMFFSMLRLGDRKPRIADGSTLVLQLDGEIPEKAPVEIPIPFIGTPTPSTVHEIWSGLRKAASDSRIKAVVVKTGRIDAGWAKAQEIRESLLEFKKSGKPLIAYVQAPRTREYYIATAADRVYIAPEDMVDVKGLRAELMYLKRTLEKVGVQAEVQHVGRYKDAGDILTETGMSPETREVMDSVLDGIYSHLLQTLAAGRKRSAEEIRTILDNGPFTAKQARDRGLVDALRFEDQVYGDLKGLTKQGEIKKLSHREYFRAIADADAGARKRIALLVGEGAISRGSGEDAMGSDEGFTSGAFIRQVRKVAADKSIDGVILRVDSPGGDAFASDAMLREVKLLAAKKPLVVSMSDSAASGGYYVAMTGDPIIAYPNTFTGSIGVLFAKFNLRGLYDKLGIQKELLTRGQNADIDTDYKPLSEAGRAKLQEGLDEFYRGFVSKVAESRKRKYEEMEPLAQGRVWLGSQAKANGLIDDIGGLDRAVQLVRTKAKIGAGERVRIVPYPPKRTLWEQYLKSTTEENVQASVRQTLGGFDYRPWLRGGVMRMMPYRIEVE